MADGRQPELTSAQVVRGISGCWQTRVRWHNDPMALADPSVIREAIRHPEPEIRETALRYFTQTRSADASVMAEVIAAAREFGHAAGWRLLELARDLPQTTATLDWALQELAQPLDREDVDEDNYHYALAWVVAEASPALLRPRHDVLAAMKQFPADLRALLEDRLRLDEASWDECWAEFEALGGEALADDSNGLTAEQHRRFDHLIEALAKHDAGHDNLSRLPSCYSARLKNRSETGSLWDSPYA